MVKVINIDKVKLQAILLFRDGDGEISARADYCLVTGEGEEIKQQSKELELTQGQLQQIRVFANQVLSKINLDENI